MLSGWLHPATLVSWGCQHQLKTMTWLGHKNVIWSHDLTRRRCGLRVKTEERLVVPWNDADLVAQVKAVLSEEQTVAPQDKGIAALPLARLNARLAPLGYIIHASKGHEFQSG